MLDVVNVSKYFALNTHLWFGILVTHLSFNVNHLAIIWLRFVSFSYLFYTNVYLCNTIFKAMCANICGSVC